MWSRRRDTRMVRRLASVVAIVLVGLFVADRADAQQVTLNVDDTTPVVGQTVTVTAACGADPTLTRITVSTSTTPFNFTSATPAVESSIVNPTSLTFPVTFNVVGDFTMELRCQYEKFPAPPPVVLLLTVTEAPPPTVATTTTSTTSTTSPPVGTRPPPAETATSTSVAGSTTTSTTTGTSTTSAPITTATVPSSAAPSTTVGQEVLPATGQSVATEAAVTAAAIVVGTGLLLVARRRDRQT